MMSGFYSSFFVYFIVNHTNCIDINGRGMLCGFHTYVGVWEGTICGFRAREAWGA